ncbi:MAG: TIGR03768 family metallophosphoesterase [Bacteroidota bacterium]
MKKKISIWNYSFIMIIPLIILNNCCQAQQAGYPIDSKIFTTVERTINPIAVPVWPVLLPNEIPKFQQYGYGEWKYGGGIGFQKRLDLMPPAYYSKPVTKSAKLLTFFAMTDIHITDKESPGEAVFFGLPPFNVISAYSPIMLYTTHVLDAAIQTANGLNKNKPFDFGISLGDVANNTQYNELRWFIDILDGKKINPDSGVKDDPIPGAHNDYQDEYQAAGLDKTIPWYATLGNHDHFWIGTNPINDYIRQTLISDSILKMGNIFAPGGFHKRDYLVGVLNGSTPNGDIIGAGPVQTTNAIKVPADPNRRSLRKEEWLNEFFNTSSSPVGHGFNKADAARGFACYSFEPKPDLPVKVIVLDDTQKDSDPDVHGYGHGTLDQERYEWLKDELDKGQAEGKLMIIACHIPIGVEEPGSFIGWWSEAYVTEAALIAKLNTYPNFLLWIAGHRHLNTVTAFKSPDPKKPELGFWEIETSSLREFPQQFRTFEIVSNSDNTISIFTTNVDPAVKEGSLAAKSRSNAIAAYQIFNIKMATLPTGSISYNAELVKQLTHEMQAKIKNYGTPSEK